MHEAGSMVDQMVINIREMINQDQIAVGQKMPSEVSLMRRFGVGRSTVREALRLLQAQGLVEIRPNAGAYLFSKTPDNRHAITWIAEHKDEVYDVLQIRLAIECVTARMAAERANEEEIYCLIGIQTLMDQAAKENDYMKLALYDEAFHDTIGKATHNPLIINMMTQITTACANFRGKTFLANKGEDACRAHNALLSAIREHDGEKAENSMRRHIQENIEMMKLYY